MDEIKLKKMEALMAAMEIDTPSTKEVAELVATIIQVVKEAKEFLEKQAHEHKMDMSDMVREANMHLGEQLDLHISNMEKMMKEHHQKMKESHKEEMDTLTTELYVELKKLKDSIPVLNFSEIYDKIKEVEKKIVPFVLKGEDVVDKINELPIEPEFQIEKEHIKGLDDELKAIRALPRGGGASRRVFQPYRKDFSSQTDGSTKIFYLDRAPLDDASVMVYGTDFPVILRPTIDFTIANKVLTLTSAVPAPSSGSTLICTYFA